ncbi:hypothetical protein CAEBREN_24586 [Caenorhabditis brenneri]|uniref:C2H2-type domain-containing protein n=1 Tax=Caenorhabditis brenneri TaxID=135651 RepID=G0MHI4_CAEBE|nr:hypothetical protein CAEBREN_24586 [Caenorhabditis brenneri]
MEIQTPMLHHNPYDFVKSEPSSTPKSLIKSTYLEANPEIVFGSFPLHSGFCTQVVAPDPMNNNNQPKTNPNGRALAADRKRPYPCNLCASKFGSKMELEEHQNSHTGQKPFECDTCNARFNRRSTLWNHKRIHSDAKPFVCTVCQMTFKWKNSLKCHKDMHQRKNETSAHLDNDLRQLTYATAAKRKLQMEQEENGGPPSSSAASIASNPLITTTQGNKKRSKAFKSKNNNNNSITTSLSQVHLGASVQPLQASSLVPPSDHQIDLDTTSLDSLMQSQNQNILMQLYGYSDDRHNGGMLALDDTMLSNLSDSKSDSGTSSGSLSIQMPLQLNMLNFRGLGTQQLPPVHHLTSSQPSVSSGMDYSSVSQHEPRYTLTGPEMMLGHQVYHNGAFVLSDKTSQVHNNQFDNCVLLPSTRQEYQPFDYTMINPPYPSMTEQVHDQAVGVNAAQQHYDEQVHPHGKTLPHEQW